MLPVIEVIGFDADDTLWHSESLYHRVQQEFQALLAPYCGDDGVMDELYETEMGNLPYWGYGIKGFTLSMIETAIRVTGGEIGARQIEKIIELAKEMKQAPVQLLPHVAEVVPTLSESHRLMLITKGDLFDQEAKIASSGLALHFDHVEIVSDKTPDVYRTLLGKHRIEPRCFVMVGNSIRSDISPVVALGGRAVHIPYPITWAHEAVPVQEGGASGYVELEHIGLLPDLIGELGRSGTGF
jgi:putative hydrolase of the HAD superfamily